jgi:hypothetical protein
MDTHFIEHHMNHRREEMQRQLRAIRLEREATSQRSGRLMRLVRILFSRRGTSNPRPASTTLPRRTPKLA